MGILSIYYPREGRIASKSNLGLTGQPLNLFVASKLLRLPNSVGWQAYRARKY